MDDRRRSTRELAGDRGAGRRVGEDREVGRLMVAPDLAGRGVGRRLLAGVEALTPAGTTRTTLFTGSVAEPR